MALPPKLKAYIQNKTNPSWDKLGIKMLVSQIAVSFLTLAICPQWGIQIFDDFDGLRGLFMKLGHNWCEFLCGTFYFLSFFIAFHFVFNIFERRKILNHFWMGHFLILSSALGFLLMWRLSLGGHIVTVLAEIHFVWLIGFFTAYLISFVKPYWNYFLIKSKNS
jgi:hypothetical protein